MASSPAGAGPRRWRTKDFNDDGRWVGDPKLTPTIDDAPSLHRWASALQTRARVILHLQEQADRAAAAADFYDPE
jgi:hypothetical protein